MRNGFVRSAAVSIPVHLGNVEANVQEILEAVRKLDAQQVQVAVFPELCLTGYTMGDLLLRPQIEQAARKGLAELARKVKSGITLIVGLPFCENGRLYNCAAVLQNGKVLGLVPKTYLPNGNEFYETRWFVGWDHATGKRYVNGEAFAADCLLGTDQLFSTADGSFKFAVEICEDLWTPIPPSSFLALSGADIIFNPSASNALVGKQEYRKQLLCQQSGRLYAGYVYAGAGWGESTSDMVFDGYTGVYENGNVLAEGKRFGMTGDMAIADIDVERLRYHRRRNGSFYQCEYRDEFCGEEVLLSKYNPAITKLMRPLDALPFIPKGEKESERLDEIVNIQCMGLMTRLRAVKCENVVIGISGGLDSTLALLVTARAFDLQGLDRKGIYAITMPGMGTGARTKSNADKLMEALGVSAAEIPIGPSVKQHFEDIGQPEGKHDVTYENAQARERTQILMDRANMVNGLVIGTGDLSEAALGFCTYNGDHMSMYNVNCAVPKTLVKRLAVYLSAKSFDENVALICQDVASTPISPELLPVTEGELNQKTEEILGDYALHDFFLYHFMDSGAPKEKLLMLALQAFEGVYEPEVIEKQLGTFLWRFRTQQFKRNCVPDGPKVGSVSLSPRGDWRMPSDLGTLM